MGNSAAGSKLTGSSGSDGTTAFQIELSNRLGLPLTLISETFSTGGTTGVLASVPLSVGTSGVLKFCGAQPPCGHAVFSCSVACKQSAPTEEMLGRAVISHSIDRRSAMAEQFLAVMMGSTAFRGRVLFGACYGTFASPDAAVKQCEGIMQCETRGSHGLCSWHLEPHRVSLEIRKTEANLLSRRSKMLDSLESRGPATSSATSSANHTVPAQATSSADHSSPSAQVAAASNLNVAITQSSLASKTTAPTDVSDVSLSIEDTGQAPELGCKTQAEAERDHYDKGSTLAPELVCKTQAEAEREHYDRGSKPLPVKKDVPVRTDAQATEVCYDGGPSGDKAVSSSKMNSTLATKDEEKKVVSSVEANRAGVERAEKEVVGMEAHSTSAADEASEDLVVEHQQGETQLEEADFGKQIPTRPERASKKSKSGLSGALALRASAAAEAQYQERLAEARRRRAEEAAKRRESEELALLRHSQDQEFQQSLLMDQLKVLMERQGPLQKELSALDAEVQEAEKIQKHASQRLAQFGGLNPKLAQESERAVERLATAAEQRPDLEAELEQVEAEIAEKNELLAAMLI